MPNWYYTRTVVESVMIVADSEDEAYDQLVDDSGSYEEEVTTVEGEWTVDGIGYDE